MLDMLKERKAALEAQGEKGFTLMEMLIVIAIIAVLIAIAIPVFTKQLEISREATDEANIRGLYSECTAAVMTGVTDNTGITITKDANGNPTQATGSVALTQQTAGFEDGKTSIDIGGFTMTSANFGLGTATVTVQSNGATTITIA